MLVFRVDMRNCSSRCWNTQFPEYLRRTRRRWRPPAGRIFRCLLERRAFQGIPLSLSLEELCNMQCRVAKYRRPLHAAATLEFNSRAGKTLKKFPAWQVAEQ